MTSLLVDIFLFWLCSIPETAPYFILVTSPPRCVQSTWIGCYLRPTFPWIKEMCKWQPFSYIVSQIRDTSKEQPQQFISVGAAASLPSSVTDVSVASMVFIPSDAAAVFPWEGLWHLCLCLLLFSSVPHSEVYLQFLGATKYSFYFHLN